jgi:hypothetical protein
MGQLHAPEASVQEQELPREPPIRLLSRRAPESPCCTEMCALSVTVAK